MKCRICGGMTEVGRYCHRCAGERLKASLFWAALAVILLILLF